jgi:nuclear factor related to kappa-B-binding protein
LPFFRDLSITTNRQQKCILTIDPSPEDVVQDFHRQEMERYKVPEKAYVYDFNGSKTIVAPMKRGVGNPGNKPREHFLLKAERPPHINLLCLVRDAAARLPGMIVTCRRAIFRIHCTEIQYRRSRNKT